MKKKAIHCLPKPNENSKQILLSDHEGQRYRQSIQTQYSKKIKRNLINYCSRVLLCQVTDHRDQGIKINCKIVNHASRWIFRVSDAVEKHKCARFG